MSLEPQNPTFKKVYWHHWNGFKAPQNQPLTSEKNEAIFSLNKYQIFGTFFVLYPIFEVNPTRSNRLTFCQHCCWMLSMYNNINSSWQFCAKLPFIYHCYQRIDLPVKKDPLLIYGCNADLLYIFRQYIPMLLSYIKKHRYVFDNTHLRYLAT